MSRFLFVTWDGGGNKMPAIAIGRELSRRGHTVKVLGHARQAQTFAEAGLAFSSYSSARAFPAMPTPLDLFRLVVDGGMQRDALAELNREPADVVVVDVILFGVMDALRRAGIAYAVLEHTLDGALRGMLPPLDAVMRLRGLRIMRLLDAGLPVLAPTIPDLDHGHGPVEHVGPVTRGVAARPTAPTVLISLSTAPFRALVPTWQKVLDAVDGLPVRVVATFGPALDPAAVRIPGNVEVHRWLAHEEIMPQASLVVGHGGHGTAMAALVHGVPLLVIPLDPTTDQPRVGRAVVRAGVGRMLPRKASSEAIRVAIEHLLRDGPERRAAVSMGERARALDGSVRGADLLERQTLVPN